jgi:hypothetical protein
MYRVEMEGMAVWPFDGKREKQGVDPMGGVVGGVDRYF